MAIHTNKDPWLTVDDQGDMTVDLREIEVDSDPFGLPVGRATHTDLLPAHPRFTPSWPTISLRNLLYVFVTGAALIILAGLSMGLANEPACVDCDETSRVGVSGSLATSSLAVHFVPCGTESVSRIAVASAETGTVYWEAVSDPPTQFDRLVVGQVTREFTETVALDDTLPRGDLLAIVEGSSVHALGFTSSQLRPSKVFWDGIHWSPNGFNDAVRSAGGCASWMGPLANSAGSTLQWGILAVALGIAGLAATRLGREDQFEDI